MIGTDALFMLMALMFWLAWFFTIWAGFKLHDRERDERMALMQSIIDLAAQGPVFMPNPGHEHTQEYPLSDLDLVGYYDQMNQTSSVDEVEGTEEPDDGEG